MVQGSGFVFQGPMSSEYGTIKTVKASLWAWVSGERLLAVFWAEPPRINFRQAADCDLASTRRAAGAPLVRFGPHDTSVRFEPQGNVEEDDEEEEEEEEGGRRRRAAHSRSASWKPPAALHLISQTWAKRSVTANDSPQTHRKRKGTGKHSKQNFGAGEDVGQTFGATLISNVGWCSWFVSEERHLLVENPKT